jgi:hypothetical protein
VSGVLSCQVLRRFPAGLMVRYHLGGLTWHTVAMAPTKHGQGENSLALEFLHSSSSHMALQSLLCKAQSPKEETGLVWRESPSSGGVSSDCLVHYLSVPLFPAKKKCMGWGKSACRGAPKHHWRSSWSASVIYSLAQSHAGAG